MLAKSAVRCSGWCPIRLNFSRRISEESTCMRWLALLPSEEYKASSSSLMYACNQTPLSKHQIRLYMLLGMPTDVLKDMTQASFWLSV